MKDEWNSLMIMTSGDDKPLDFATTFLQLRLPSWKFIVRQLTEYFHAIYHDFRHFFLSNVGQYLRHITKSSYKSVVLIVRDYLAVIFDATWSVACIFDAIGFVTSLFGRSG